jgi:hypothetical protein
MPSIGVRAAFIENVGAIIGIMHGRSDGARAEMLRAVPLLRYRA